MHGDNLSIDSSGEEEDEEEENANNLSSNNEVRLSWVSY